MVEAEPEIRHLSQIVLANRVRDPATAFPPLKEQDLCCIWLSSRYACANRNNGIRSKIHQPPNIYISIRRIRRIVKVNSCKFEIFYQEDWSAQPKSVRC